MYATLKFGTIKKSIVQPSNQKISSSVQENSLKTGSLWLLYPITNITSLKGNDVNVIYGLDVPDIIMVFTTALAVILGTISFVAYRRDQRLKFLLVTLAFVFFALKGILIIGGDFLSYEHVFDITAALLDFVVLSCIFLSITMK